MGIAFNESIDPFGGRHYALHDRGFARTGSVVSRLPAYRRAANQKDNPEQPMDGRFY
jgi:hypothetical protein